LSVSTSVLPTSPVKMLKTIAFSKDIADQFGNPKVVFYKKLLKRQQ